MIRKPCSHNLISAMASACLLTACAVGPDYERPNVNAPEQFRSAVTTEANPSATAPTSLSSDAWWEGFNDPVLNDLVEEALRNNRDLQSAIARVRKARGQLVTTRGKFFPQVEYYGAGERGKFMGLDQTVVTSTPGSLTTIGTMAMLALFGHASRPTVGEAIRKGLAATPITILAQMIIGFVMTGLVLAPVTLLSLGGSKALGAVGLLIGMAIAAWFWTRTCLTTPIIAVEGTRNPLAAVQRSFALTKGNAGRLLLFLFLLVLAFIIGGELLQIAMAMLVQLVAGPHAGTITAALVASVAQTALAVYVAAAMAASHRQLGAAGSPGLHPFG